MSVAARYAGDEPVPLADTLAAVGAELGIPAGNAHGDARHALGRRRRAPTSRRTRGCVSVRDGVLTVAVDDPIWATQLRYLEADGGRAGDGPRRARRGDLGAGARGLIRAPSEKPTKSAGRPPNPAARLVH